MYEFFTLFSSMQVTSEVLYEFYKIELDYWQCLLTAALIFLVFYSFKAAGLYIAAKKAGAKRAWFAFVPFLNSYLFGELSGANSFASFKIPRIPLWYTLTEGV